MESQRFNFIILRRPESPDTGSRGARSLSRGPSRGPASGIYATLPRGLTQDLQVKVKESEATEAMKGRKALVEAKSPAELSQIGAFSEIPVPRAIENIFASNKGNG